MTYTRYAKRNQVAYSLNGGLIMKTIAKVVEILIRILYNKGYSMSFEQKETVTNENDS